MYSENQTVQILLLSEIRLYILANYFFLKYFNGGFHYTVNTKIELIYSHGSSSCFDALPRFAVICLESE